MVRGKRLRISSGQRVAMDCGADQRTLRLNETDRKRENYICFCVALASQYIFYEWIKYAPRSQEHSTSVRRYINLADTSQEVTTTIIITIIWDTKNAMVKSERLYGNCTPSQSVIRTIYFTFNSVDLRKSIQIYLDFVERKRFESIRYASVWISLLFLWQTSFSNSDACMQW